MRDFLSFKRLMLPDIIQVMYALGAAVLLAGSVWLLASFDIPTKILGAFLLTFGEIFWRFLCEREFLRFSMYKELAASNEYLQRIAEKERI